MGIEILKRLRTPTNFLETLLSTSSIWFSVRTKLQINHDAKIFEGLGFRQRRSIAG